MQVWTLGLVLLLAGQAIAQGRGSRRYQPQTQSSPLELEDTRPESRFSGRKTSDDAAPSRTPGRRGESVRQETRAFKSRDEARHAPSKQPEPTRLSPRTEGRREIPREETVRIEASELVRHQPKYPEPKEEQQTRQGRGRFSSRNTENNEATPKPTERIGRQRKNEERQSARLTEEETSTERVFLSRNNNPRPQRTRTEESQQPKSRNEVDEPPRPRGRERRPISRQPSASLRNSSLKQEIREEIRKPERSRASPLDVPQRHRFQSRGNERITTTSNPIPERRVPKPRPVTSAKEESGEILQADSVGPPAKQAYRPRQPSSIVKLKEESFSKDLRSPSRTTAALDRGSAKGPTLSTKTNEKDDVLEDDNYPETPAIEKERNEVVSHKEKVDAVSVTTPAATLTTISTEEIVVEPVTSPKPLAIPPRSEKFPPRNNRRPNGALKPIPINLREKNGEHVLERLQNIDESNVNGNDKRRLRENGRNIGRNGKGRNQEKQDSRAEGTRSRDVRTEQVVSLPYPLKEQSRKEKIALPKLKLGGQEEAKFSRREDLRNDTPPPRGNTRNNGIGYPKRKDTSNKYAETLSSEELSTLRRQSNKSNFSSRREPSSPSRENEEVFHSREESSGEFSSRNDTSHRRESKKNATEKKTIVETTSLEPANVNEVPMTKSEEDRSPELPIREQLKQSSKNTLAPKDSVYSWIIDSENLQTTEKTKFQPREQKKYSAKISEKSEHETSTSVKPRYELYQRNKENILSRKASTTATPEDTSKPSDDEVNVSKKYFNRPRPTYVPPKKAFGKTSTTPLAHIPRFRARKAAETTVQVKRNKFESSEEITDVTKPENNLKKEEQKPVRESHIQKIPNKYKVYDSTKSTIVRRTADLPESTTSMSATTESGTEEKEMEQKPDDSTTEIKTEAVGKNDSEGTTATNPDNDVETVSGRSLDDNENESIEDEEEEEDDDDEEMSEDDEEDEDEENDEEEENDNESETETTEKSEEPTTAVSVEGTSNVTTKQEESVTEKSESEVNLKMNKVDESNTENAETEVNSEMSDKEDNVTPNNVTEVKTEMANEEENVTEAEIKSDDDNKDSTVQKDVLTNDGESVTTETPEEDEDEMDDDEEEEEDDEDDESENETETEESPKEREEIEENGLRFGNEDKDIDTTTDAADDVTTEKMEDQSEKTDENPGNDDSESEKNDMKEGNNDDATTEKAEDESENDDSTVTEKTEETTETTDNESEPEKTEDVTGNSDNDDKDESETTESTTETSNNEKDSEAATTTVKTEEENEKNNEVDSSADEIGKRIGMAEEDFDDEEDTAGTTESGPSSTTTVGSLAGTTTENPPKKASSKKPITKKPTSPKNGEQFINEVSITPPTFRTIPTPPTPPFSWGGGCCASSVIIVTPGTPTPPPPYDSRTSLLSSFHYAAHKLSSGSYLAVTTPLPSPNSIPTRKPFPTKLAGSRFVYALTPDNKVVRKIIHTTESPKDVPFIIFGLYPNGTISRRFPNGSVVPPEMTEANVVIGSIPDPKYTKEHLEYIIQRDKSLAYQYPERFLTTASPPRALGGTARQGRLESSVIQRIGDSSNSLNVVVEPTLRSGDSTESTATSTTTAASTMDSSSTSSTTIDLFSSTTIDASSSSSTTMDSSSSTTMDASSPSATTMVASSTSATTMDASFSSSSATTMDELSSTSGTTMEAPSATSATTMEDSTMVGLFQRFREAETTPLEEPSTTDSKDMTTTDDAPTTAAASTTSTTAATTTTPTTTTAVPVTTPTTIKTTAKSKKKSNGRKSSRKSSRNSKKNKTSTTTTTTKKAETTTAEATTIMITTTTTEATTTPTTTTTTTTQPTTTPPTTTTQTVSSTTKKAKKSGKSRNSSSRKSSKKSKSRTSTTTSKPTELSSAAATTPSITTTTTTEPSSTVAMTNPVFSTAKPILASSQKPDVITIDPEIRNRLNDIEILNNFLKSDGTSGDAANGDLAERVIQLAMERAQTVSSATPSYDGIQALASTTSAISTTDKNSITGSPVDKTNGGKISVWVVPPEGEVSSTNNALTQSEIDRLNSILSTPSTIENLSPSEQLIIADLISSTGRPYPITFPTARSSKQLTSSSNYPLLQSLFPNGRPLLGGSSWRTPHYGPADQAGEHVEDEPGLVMAAINITKAVSQFMTHVIQGAVNNFQSYVSTRTQALARYLSSSPPRA